VTIEGDQQADWRIKYLYLAQQCCLGLKVATYLEMSLTGM